MAQFGLKFAPFIAGAIKALFRHGPQASDWLEISAKRDAVQPAANGIIEDCAGDCLAAWRD